MANLNPKQFFHGTTAKLEPGDVLRPGREIGAQQHSPFEPEDEPDPDLGAVFSTHDERDAWAFAINASQNSRAYGPEPMRPVVYEVEPQGRVRGREEWELPNTPRETMSDTAVVKRRIDIPAPNGVMLDYSETGPAVQGTLPGDDPNFAHGFMDEYAAEKLADMDSTKQFHDRSDTEWFRNQQAEVKFRNESGHPTLFNGEEFHDLSYLDMKRHGPGGRGRW